MRINEDNKSEKRFLSRWLEALMAKFPFLFIYFKNGERGQAREKGK